MRRVGMVTAGTQPDIAQCAERAEACLQARNITVVRMTGTVPPEEPVDAVLALGGDGTILRSAQWAARTDTPLLGINLGTLGFLAEAEPDALEASLDALVRGEYAVDARPMLQVTASGGTFLALNDAVITRGGYARLIRVQTLLNGQLAGECRADGLIVATPTGSTGYSLSAGGPIVDPQVDCMIVTPVCAHSLHQRPYVVPGGALITLRLAHGAEAEALLQVDGQALCHLSSGDEVSIARSERKVRLVRLKELDFFGIVHKKLAEWSS